MTNQIEKQDRYSVSFSGNEIVDTYCFHTLEEAKAKYEEITGCLLSDTEKLDDKHWYNNRTGLQVELCELTTIPEDEYNELLETEDEEDFEEAWGELIYTYSDCLETTKTFLSDEFDEDKNEFIIKEQRIEGRTYGTVPFSKEGINILTGEKSTIKGAIA